MNNKILIIGLGYVGLSQAILFYKYNKVDIFDIDKKKISLINKSKSPIEEKEFQDYFRKNEISITGYDNQEDINNNYDFILICLPSNFSKESKKLDTSIIESYVKFFVKHTDSKIIIKSTLPIGFTDYLIKEYDSENISFSPEFLREGSSINDVINPSRVIYGPDNSCSYEFNKVLSKSLNNKNQKVRYMSAAEAEAVKLFSNTFLAMRVAFFNEIDNLAIKNNLDSKKIIKGVSDDNRIGMYYNNPSFGYGGYCLPKDSKELATFMKSNNIPSSLINSVNISNDDRKQFILEYIMEKNPNLIGIYRINMKSKSKNFRESSIIDILIMLKNKNCNILIYEPLLKGESFYECKLEDNLNEFKAKADLIISNRIDDQILDVRHKVFSRDIFNKD